MIADRLFMSRSDSQKTEELIDSQNPNSQDTVKYMVGTLLVGARYG